MKLSRKSFSVVACLDVGYRSPTLLGQVLSSREFWRFSLNGPELQCSTAWNSLSDDDVSVRAATSVEDPSAAPISALFVECAQSKTIRIKNKKIAGRLGWDSCNTGSDSIS